MKIQISYGPFAGIPANQQKDFKIITLSDTYKELPELTKTFSYSAIEFKNNIRLGVNFKKAHVIILDFDEGMTISKAREIFKDYHGMIATTKSHQQTTKGGLPDGKPIEERDRFRAILPLKEPITDPKEFVTVMTNITNKYGSDPACKDLARYYFPNPTQEVWCMENATSYIDIDPFKQDISKPKVSMSSSQSKKDLPKSTTLKEYLMIQKDQEIISADGETKTAKVWYDELDVDDKVTVHCPFPEHEDGNPSAFIEKNGKEALFAFCNSCGRKGFFNVKGSSKYSKQKNDVEQKDISIAQFSNVILQKLQTVGEFNIEDVVQQFLSTGYALTSLAGSLYFWVDGYWQKHQDLEHERKIFIKKSLEKITGKRPSKRQIVLTHEELLTELIEFKKEDATLINFASEVLIMKDGKTNLVPHSMQFDLKYKLPYNHSYSAKCPNIDKFMLATIGDEETVKFFYQFIASVFIRNDYIKIEKALFLYGVGSNGKSVVLDLLKALLGQQNISHVPLDQISDETKRIAMVGKLLNIASEGSSSALKSEDFKAMVSKEHLQVRSLFKNSSTTNDFPRLVFATNNLPQTGGDYSDGLYRRIAIIPFENIIPEEKQDKQLLSKLLPELEGMMRHVLSGLWNLNTKKTLKIPQKVKEAQRRYEIESNPIKYFVESEGYTNVKMDTAIKDVKELYFAFQSFCKTSGIQAMERRGFATQMSTIFGKQAHSNKLRGWRIVKE